MNEFKNRAQKSKNIIGTSLKPSSKSKYFNKSPSKPISTDMESKNFWNEEFSKKSSSINRSSVHYNIINQRKNYTSGTLPPIERFENKKISVSKYVDIQNSHHHHMTDIHKIYFNNNRKIFHKVASDITNHYPKNIAGMQYRQFYKYKAIY